MFQPTKCFAISNFNGFFIGQSSNVAKNVNAFSNRLFNFLTLLVEVSKLRKILNAHYSLELIEHKVYL